MQLCEEEDDATSVLAAPKPEPNDQSLQVGDTAAFQEVISFCPWVICFSFGIGMMVGLKTSLLSMLQHELQVKLSVSRDQISSLLEGIWLHSYVNTGSGAVYVYMFMIVFNFQNVVTERNDRIMLLDDLSLDGGEKATMISLQFSSSWALVRVVINKCLVISKTQTRLYNVIGFLNNRRGRTYDVFLRGQSIRYVSHVAHSKNRKAYLASGFHSKIIIYLLPCTLLVNNLLCKSFQCN